MKKGCTSKFGELPVIRNFEICAKLTEVVIPAGVRIIGEEAFAECPCEPELKKKYPHLFP